MINCKVVYKCQICGELIQFGEPVNMPYDDMPKFCGKVVQNPYLHKAPMQLVHKCSNGHCGMAYFAGLQQI